MLVQSAWEEIYELFPSKGTAIYKDLDSAQKEFCNDTKILHGRGQLTSITTNFGWTLPSDCIEVYDLKAYDSNNELVYLGTELLAWEIEFGKIYIYSLTSTVITSIPTSISSIYIHYRKSPSTISSASSSFDVNEKYHKGIVAKVLSEYYRKYPTEMALRDGTLIKSVNIPLSREWDMIYQKHRIEAKKDANKKQNASMGEAIYYPHAGGIELPQRPYDSSVSTTTVVGLVGLSSIYSKYVVFTAVEGETTGIILGQLGYTGTLSVAISGNTITLTSTAADFGVYTKVEQSNEDINWVRTDSSTVTLSGYTGWIRTKAQVYELLV